MKQEILKAIKKRIKESDFDIYPDAGEQATDIHYYEMETRHYTFDITVQIWVKDTVTQGLELENIEFMDFMAWDKDGNDAGIDISQQEFIENVKLY